MDNKKSKPLGGGVYQLNNRCNYLPFDLQLFALEYNKVDNPYNFYLNKDTWTKGDIKEVYNLERYYEKIPNYSTITTLPEENADYIKEALPNVTSCYRMLYGCRKLTSIDTTGWDTSNITDMSYMFQGCNALTTLDLSNWDSSNVGGMNWMFQGCFSLTTLDLSKWDTSNVTNMDRMFGDCQALTTITGVIDMKSCTSYAGMFRSCTKLTGVKIKNPPSGITATSGIGELKAGKYTIVS